MSIIRVAIAEDHAEMRVALRLFLRLSKDVEIVCEAGNGEEAVDCVKQLQPDILIMDIQMPVLDGWAATQQILALGLPTQVILISLNRGRYIASKAAEVGAKGFLSKDYLPNSLLPAIQVVHQGGKFFEE
jgi:DNA-binding NarL/FixJ family response regulator